MTCALFFLWSMVIKYLKVWNELLVEYSLFLSLYSKVFHFLMYFLYDKYNFFTSQSLWISIPIFLFSFLQLQGLSFQTLLEVEFAAWWLETYSYRQLTCYQYITINKWKNLKTIPCDKHNYHSHSYNSYY